MFCHIANSSLIHLSRMSQAHKEQKNMSGKVAGLHPLMVRVAGLQMIWSLKDQRDSKRSSELSSVFHLDFSHLSLHIPSPPPWFLWLPWLPMVSHRSHDCTTALPSFGETVTLRIAASPPDARRVASARSPIAWSPPCRRVAIRAAQSLHLGKNDSDLWNCPWRMVEAWVH